MKIILIEIKTARGAFVKLSPRFFHKSILIHAPGRSWHENFLEKVCSKFFLTTPTASRNKWLEKFFPFSFRSTMSSRTLPEGWMSLTNQLLQLSVSSSILIMMGKCPIFPLIKLYLRRNKLFSRAILIQFVT